MKRFLSAAALLTLFLTGASYGVIVYSGPQNISIPLSFNGVYLNVLSGTTSASQPGTWNTEPWINPFFGGVDISNDELVQIRITGADQALNLPAGSVVNAIGSYTIGESGSTTHFGPAANQFQASTPGYIGFSFQPTTGGQSFYGWARVTINNSSVGTIHEWAYDNTPGTGIVVGAIPEPGAAAMLLLGVACVGMRRKRSVAL